MLLILTDKNDVHAHAVIEELNLLEVPFFRLNLDVASLKKSIVTYGSGAWSINQAKRIFKSSEISCVWVRKCFVELSLEEQENGEIDFKIWKNEWNKTLLGLYSALRHLPWLNPWRKGYEAENKFLQMEIAEKVGFKLPPSIVSNDKASLVAFEKKHGEVALKLMHQDMYKKANEFVGLYVNKLEVGALKKFKAKEENPIVLQKYIEKKFEIRYTVIGTHHFVCKIESQFSEKAKIDWRRYDIPNTPHSAIDPPSEIRNKVNRFMRKLNIEYGALDFIVDPDGNWYFLEVNAMGQFLWIEELAGLKISREIARWAKKNINLRFIKPTK